MFYIYSKTFIKIDYKKKFSSYKLWVVTINSVYLLKMFHFEVDSKLQGL